MESVYFYVFVEIRGFGRFLGLILTEAGEAVGVVSPAGMGGDGCL